MEELNQQVIILPSAVNHIAIQGIARDMETSFVHDREQLRMVLEIFGVAGIEEGLVIISDFFLKKIGKKKLTFADLENLNLKKLIYEFIDEMGIAKPKFSSEEERKIVVDILSKLGRLYIHDVLLPELIEINPRLAYSMIQLLIRTASSIAIAQGVEKKLVVDSLMLDQIDIPLQANQIEEPKKSKKSYKTIKVRYLMPDSIKVSDIEKIAEILKDQGYIYKKLAFVAILNSNGSDVEPMKIPAAHVKLVAHLIYRMYKPLNPNHRKLIRMSFGKGYWDFLQENIIDETGNVFGWPLKNFSSDVKRKPGHDHIKSEVEAILKQYYDKYNQAK